jgi:hypothetical protein
LVTGGSATCSAEGFAFPKDVRPEEPPPRGLEGSPFHSVRWVTDGRALQESRRSCQKIGFADFVTLYFQWFITWITYQNPIF